MKKLLLLLICFTNGLFAETPVEIISKKYENQKTELTQTVNEKIQQAVDQGLEKALIDLGRPPTKNEIKILTELLPRHKFYWEVEQTNTILIIWGDTRLEKHRKHKQISLIMALFAFVWFVVLACITIIFF